MKVAGVAELGLHVPAAFADIEPHPEVEAWCLEGGFDGPLPHLSRALAMLATATIEDRPFRALVLYPTCAGCATTMEPFRIWMERHGYENREFASPRALEKWWTAKDYRVQRYRCTRWEWEKTPRILAAVWPNTTWCAAMTRNLGDLPHVLVRENHPRTLRPAREFFERKPWDADAVS